MAAQKVGGNESVGSAISIIKGVNVHKEIMEERQPDEKRVFFRMKDAECLVQGLNNPAFRIQSLLVCHRENSLSPVCLKVIPSKQKQKEHISVKYRIGEKKDQLNIIS